MLLSPGGEHPQPLTVGHDYRFDQAPCPIKLQSRRRCIKTRCTSSSKDPALASRFVHGVRLQSHHSPLDLLPLLFNTTPFRVPPAPCVRLATTRRRHLACTAPRPAPCLRREKSPVVSLRWPIAQAEALPSPDDDAPKYSHQRPPSACSTTEPPSTVAASHAPYSCSPPPGRFRPNHLLSLSMRA